MVAIEAWIRATCDSRTIVTLSRKRRSTRVPTVRKIQVAAAETAKPMAAMCTRPGRFSSTPRPSSMSPKASNASRGSGETSLVRSLEDVIRDPLFILGRAESSRLQVEHRPIAAVQGHELGVRAELDHPPLLEHADAVGMTYGGEAV